MIPTFTTRSHDTYALIRLPCELNGFLHLVKVIKPTDGEHREPMLSISFESATLAALQSNHHPFEENGTAEAAEQVS